MAASGKFPFASAKNKRASQFNPYQLARKPSRLRVMATVRGTAGNWLTFTRNGNDYGQGQANAEGNSAHHG